MAAGKAAERTDVRGITLTANASSTPTPAPNSRRTSWGTFIVVGLALVAVGVMIWLWPSSPRTHRVKMVTDIEPHRNLLGQQIREEGYRHHLDLELSAKNYGALTALAEADTPSDVKLALVPGGIKAKDYSRVRVVATLANEPLHVLVRPELAGGGLSALRGRRVDLGPDTTASHHLARAVLAFAGLKPTSDRNVAGYTLESTDLQDLHRALDRIETLSGSERTQAVSKLPDAVLFLAPLPSLLARRLVTEIGYDLLPVPFAEAFCVERLSPPDSGGIRIDCSVMGSSVIPAYTYRGDPPVPAKPCPTICAPLLLIAQDDTDPEAVFRLLETVYDSPLKNAIRPPELHEQAPPFPFHTGTERFLRRHEPWLTPDAASKLKSLIGGLASFASGAIGLYTFLRIRKIRRFESYYRELSRIELIARGQMADPNCPHEPVARRAELEARLSALRCRIFQDFARGGLKGESELAGIVAMINDTRKSLAGPELQVDAAAKDESR